MTALQTIAVAFAMFSALPMPQFDWNEKNMRYAMCAFPLIGVVIGAAWCACGALPLPGFAKAAELRMENFEEKLRHMAGIKAYAMERLGEIPDLKFVAKGTAPHVLSVSMPGYPSQNVVNELSEAGICITPCIFWLLGSI